MPRENETTIDCPQCGEPTEQFVEGFCVGCHRERQDRLDEHNARFDWWNSLTDTERDMQIRRACTYA